MKRAIFTLLVALAILAPIAQAEKKNIEAVSCRSGTVEMLSSDKQALVMTVDLSGINTEGGVTSRCIGVIRVIAGKRSGGGFCKYQDPDGDINLIEWTTYAKSGEGTWKYVYGTGKWKGVTGGGTYTRVAQGKPIAKGTFQNCLKSVGTYEVSK